MHTFAKQEQETFKIAMCSTDMCNASCLQHCSKPSLVVVVSKNTCTSACQHCVFTGKCYILDWRTYISQVYNQWNNPIVL